MALTLTYVEKVIIPDHAGLQVSTRSENLPASLRAFSARDEIYNRTVPCGFLRFAMQSEVHLRNTSCVKREGRMVKLSNRGCPFRYEIVHHLSFLIFRSK